MISRYLGIDTSNYTTSSAIYSNCEIVQSKKLLPVKSGSLGLRQSDAVFHHTRQLPEILARLDISNLKAIGVSDKPRNQENSYMPCFLVGKSAAEILAQSHNIPIKYYSHQQGHIAAALYSAKRLDLLDKDFIAFHLSGGTSEALLVKGGVLGKIKIISKTLDISAGQAVDRVGLMLGLDFPCGKKLDELSDINKHIKTKTALKGNDFSLSGLENQCQKLLKQNEDIHNIASYCLNYITNTLNKVLEQLTSEYQNLPVIFSGGVASNRFIQNTFQKKSVLFASPDFSCDNAAGTAILTAYELGEL